MPNAKKNPAAGDAAGGAVSKAGQARALLTTGRVAAQPGVDALPPFALQHAPGDTWLVWIAGVRGMELTDDELHSYRLFRRAVRERFDRDFAHVKRADWYLRLEEALAVMREGGSA